MDDAATVDPWKVIHHFSIAINLLRAAHGDVTFDTPEDEHLQWAVLDAAQRAIGDYESIIARQLGNIYKAPEWRAEPDDIDENKLVTDLLELAEDCLIPERLDEERELLNRARLFVGRPEEYGEDE